MAGPPDPERALAEFEQRLDRSAFGWATRASYRRESAEEDVALRAATNLLTKASRRLDLGQDTAAHDLARRALAQGAGALAASLLVFDALTGRIARGGDDVLDPVLVELGTLPAPIALELARNLDSLVALGVPPALERRVRAVVPSAPRFDEPLEALPDPDERLRAVLDLLRLAERIRRG
ncbi:hypothetical protein QDR37_11435 [Amnibacterium sp. CER49]|uniref:hypothetical protein n=1 Tax=Amnibacterium sp. CER49 TaxID=3039161 RepID=UPI00244A228B|nr:hypothetical protein [Amnibacterium sp. CER49]MDH2444558.1 hypothetical protein [Amnibacterium sp. CER49]